MGHDGMARGGAALGTAMPRTDHDGTVAQVPLFGALEAAERREVAAVLRQRSFAPGESIFLRDDPGDVLYILRAGRVKIYVTSPEGQEVVLAVFGPGDYFGELALLDGQPRSASAVALEQVEALTLRRSDFLAVLLGHPNLAAQVLSVLARRLRQTDAMVEDLLFLDVHGRVAKKLLELADVHGERTAEGIRIPLRMTQSDLAALVGASRESVNKVLGYFIEKRFISVEKRMITVLRLAELRRRIF